jgi:fructan beta-fructosidase
VVLKVRGALVRYVPGLLRCQEHAAPLCPVDGRVRLRVLVDRASLEVFANGGAVSITTPFTPPAADRGLELYAENGTARVVSLRVWRMKSAWEGAR